MAPEQRQPTAPTARPLHGNRILFMTLINFLGTINVPTCLREHSVVSDVILPHFICQLSQNRREPSKYTKLKKTFLFNPTSRLEP